MKHFLCLLLAVIVCGCSSGTDTEQPDRSTFLVNGRTWTYAYTDERTGEQLEEIDSVTHTRRYDFIDGDRNRHTATNWYFLKKSYQEGTRIQSIGGYMSIRNDSLVMGRMYDDKSQAIDSYLPIDEKAGFTLDAPLVVSTLVLPYTITYRGSESVTVPAGSFVCDIYRFEFADSNDYYTDVAISMDEGIISETCYHVTDGPVEKRELKSYRK